MIYSICLEEYVFDVDHPTQTAFSAQRDIRLPFIPTIGLCLALTPQGLEMGGDYMVSDVVWDCATETCFVFSERPLRDADEVRSAAISMEQAGWTISHGEPVDDVAPEDDSVDDDYVPIERVTAELIAALKLRTMHLPSRQLTTQLLAAVNGLFLEVRTDGNSHHGESAIETLRAMHQDLMPTVRAQVKKYT